MSVGVGVSVGIGIGGILSVPVAVDGTPPGVANVVVSAITGHTATIAFDTDEPTTGYVAYGLTSSYGGISDIHSVPATHHSFDLTGLADGQTIHYQIQVQDQAGNPTLTADATFATPDVTGPAITLVSGSETKRATIASGAQVTILWQTALELGDSKVEYGTVASGAFGSATAVTNTSPRVNAHSVVVQGLVANTPYQFRPVSVDAAGNSVTGATVTVTTEWTPALLGSDLVYWLEPDFLAIADGTTVATPVDHSGAHVGVLTQPSANPRATFHRANSSFANGSPCLTFDGTDDNYSTATDVNDWDLSANDYTLLWCIKPTTAAAEKFLISHYNADNSIRWAIKQETSGAYSIYEDGKGADQTTTSTDFADGTNYALMYRRIGTTTTYSRNGSNDIQTFTGMSITAGTEGTRVGASRNGAARWQGDLMVGLIVKNAISDGDRTECWDYLYRHGYITDPDLRAPVLVGTPTATETVVATGGAGASVRFDWVNDELSSSIVKYSLNSDMSSATTSSETDTSPRVTTHSRTLTGFLSNTTYYYQVQSKDAAGNTMTSPTGSFTTTLTLEALAPAYWVSMNLTPPTDNAAVTTLTDLSANGIVLTQGSAPARATGRIAAANGANCLRFSGAQFYESAGHVAALDLTGAKTILVVGRLGALATNAPFIGAFDTTPFTTRWQELVTAAGALRYQSSGGGSDDTTYAGLEDGFNHAYITTVSAGGALKHYIDSGDHDTTTGATNTAPTGKVVVGANGAGTVFLVGDIVELAVFDYEFSAANLALAWRYLGQGS